MKRSELIKLLKRNHCYFVDEGTNHEIWHSDLTGRDFLLWRHSQQEIPTGTLNKILKDAGVKK